MSESITLFANNLRRLRKSAGMTQAELARAIGYSEKTVSKWECASGIPDIDGLFALSRQLQVSVEELFADNSAVYFLGIDGGGTKTTMLLTDAGGHSLRKIKIDASNPMDIGLEACTQLLRRGIYEICDGVDLSSVVMFAGIAGATSVKEELQSFFKTIPLRMAFCDSDNASIMEAALGDRDGITMILGTGICVWSKVDGMAYRTGGWGYLVNEGGSAFDIGQDALKAYYATVDGSATPTELTFAIGDIFRDDAALLKQIYAGGKKWIASLAPMVFEAAEAGDSTAKAIIHRNLSVAARMIETAAQRFTNSPVEVVITGGMTNQPQVLQLLNSALKEPGKFDLRILDAEPVKGAVALAQKFWSKAQTP